MNNTDIPLKEETYEVVDVINFGMLNYTQHWGGKDTKTATFEENYNIL